MFDFDGHVVGQMRMVGVKSFENTSGVGDAIEEIRVAEGDVLRACCDLLTNVGENNVESDYTKLALINGNDRTMAAEMFAAAGSFRVARNFVCAVWQNNVRIFVESGKIGTVRNFEYKTRHAWVTVSEAVCGITGCKRIGELRKMGFEFWAENA